MADYRAELEFALRHAIGVRPLVMLDEGTATRPGSQPQTPELDANGDVIPGADEVIYTGPCSLIEPRSALLSGRTINDQSGVPSQRVLQLPADSPGLRSGDLFTITASTVAPGLVGDTFVVDSEQERTYATCRRYELRGSSWQAPSSAPTSSPQS